MISVLRSLPLIAASVLVAGCAAQGPFPSLAPRAVERDLAGEDEPLPPCIPGAEAEAEETAATPMAPAQTEADPVLLARIEQLKSEAREGDSAFEQALPKAAAAVEGAGAAGTEAWVAAQVAVSEAEVARTPTATALAELNALALEEATEPANPLDQRAIEEATAEVRTLADRQSSRLDELKASLSDL
jgi:hypothetical protein